MKRLASVGLAFCVAFSASAMTASAQDAAPAPAGTDTPAASDTPAVDAPAADAPAPAAAPVAKPKPKKAKAAKPAATGPWIGSWTGSLSQVGRASPYAIDITLTAKGGDTSYPGQNCTGKLVRTGTSGDYAFFVETITAGKFDPASKAGCLDGSLTLEKSADGLVMTWMTGYNGKAVVAYGALQPAPK